MEHSKVIAGRRQKTMQQRTKAWLALGGVGILFTATSHKGSAVGKAQVQNTVLVATAQYGVLVPRIAWVSGKAWKNAHDREVLFRAPHVFRTYNRTGQATGVPLRTGKLLPADGEIPATLETTPKIPETQSVSLLALSGEATQPKRTVRSEPASVSDKAVVQQLLQTKGIRQTAPRYAPTLVTDLDGDGTVERLINAQSNYEVVGVTLRHLYSIACLRTASGRVVSLGSQILVRGSEGQEERYQIIGVADVDGDGKREIAIEFAPYEGSSLFLYKWDGTVVRSVLNTLTDGIGNAIH